jgi:ABC-type glycerol-3-phosphate transport system permease component
MAHALKIYNTRLMLVLANTSFVLPICVWFLKAYIDQIPVELEEAALIDGATRLRGLWLITLPLVVPGLIGVGALAFLRSWNEFLFAVSFTETARSQTLTVGISLFFGEYVRDWGGIMALTTVASVPLLIIFFVFQKRVIEGVMQGSLK